MAPSPRRNVYTAFKQPGVIHTQVSRMPDGTTFLCIARTVRKRGYGAPQGYLSIGLGCEVGYAREPVYADGKDRQNPDLASPIGVACRIFERMDCRHRPSRRSPTGSTSTRTCAAYRPMSRRAEGRKWL